MITPLLAALLAAPLRAQAPASATSIKAVRRLNRAPVSKEVLKVTLPRPTIRKLGNGLTVMVIEQHKLPTLSAALWIEDGALSDPADLPGLAKFTAELLREGTRTRTSEKLAQEVDELGATLEASAGFGSDLTGVSASGLAEDGDKLLELMADVALSPTFPADELEKYKKRQLAELEQLRANPQFLAKERFYEALYRDATPAKVAPTAASIRAATPKALADFHDRYYVPDNAILGIAGDVTPAQAFALADKHFGSWSGKKTGPSGPPQVQAPPKLKVLLVDRPGSVQTEILAGNVSLARTSPDYIPLVVANRILGGGASARLFLQLREEKGYTYGAYSSFNADIYPGPFTARLAVRNDVTEPATRDLLAELKRIRNEPVPADELDDARRAIVAGFALSLERPATLLGLWMSARYYGLPDDYWDRYPEEIARTTPEQVQAVAAKYIGTEDMLLVLVGDAKLIGKPAQKFGPVEAYDADGKRKDLVDAVP